MEEQMTRHLVFVEGNKKPLMPDDQSHEPAKHIEETARLAGSVETAKDPDKIRRTKTRPTVIRTMRDDAAKSCGLLLWRYKPLSGFVAMMTPTTR